MPSIQEALEAAINDNEEQEAGGSEPNTPEPVGVETEEVTAEVAEPASEDDAEVVAARADTEKPVDNPPSSTEAADGAELPAGEAVAEELRAPQSWKIEAREHWNTLPEGVKQEIARRERDINVALQQSAETRRLADEFQQVVSPYQALIASHGGTPMQTIHNLLNTAAGLSLGTQQQKAALVAQVIQDFGVDINELDSLLAGQGPVNPQAAQLEQLLEQKLAPVQQFMGELQNTRLQHQMQVQQSTQSEIDNFGSKHEFFEDVRLDMADVMDFAAARGQSLTLDEAYERAIALRPDIQNVINARKQAVAAQGASGGVLSKQNAASSLKSAGQGSDREAPTSLRGAIADAFENS